MRNSVQARISCLLVMMLLSLPSSLAAQCLVYRITITGRASGNYFQLLGTLKVLNTTITKTTSNGVNPFELSLEVGDPLITPRVGSISFCTNTAMRGQRSAIDMVRFRKLRNAWLIDPDPAISALSVNYFNSSSGLLGSIYNIDGGTLAIQFGDQAKTVAAAIQFNARGAYYYLHV